MHETTNYPTAFHNNTTTSNFLQSSFSNISNDIDETCVTRMVPPVFVTIIVVGLVGNLFVMLTVATNMRMRNTTNILIFNLALADLLFILICVPATGLLYTMEKWPLGLFLCRVSQYLLYVTAHASIYTLVFMSFDRYLAVVHPIFSMTLRSTKNALIAVGVLWVVVMAFNAPLFVDAELVEWEEDLLCLNPNLISGTYPKVFYGTFFFLGLVLPLLIIIVLYTFMVLRLMKMGRTTKGRNIVRDKRKSKDGLIDGGETKGKRISESMRSKRRVMKMIIVVVTIFVICWTPIHVIFLLQAFVLDDVDITDRFICIRVFCNCLAYANSCVNPILYAFLSESFRANFKKLCSLLCFGRYFRSRNDQAMLKGKTYCEKTTVLASVIEMQAMKSGKVGEKDGENVRENNEDKVQKNKEETEIENRFEQKVVLKEIIEEKEEVSDRTVVRG